jgi:outer membrane protein assembly factor BamB
MMNILSKLTSLSCLIVVAGFSACGGGGNDCTSHFRKYCVEDRLYWQDSCQHYEDLISECACGCADDGFECKTGCTNCTPDCGDRVCGPVPNGCGLSCGTCAEGSCNQETGECEQNCQPASCDDLSIECGTWLDRDGCGGDLMCGDCPTDETCDANGHCQVKGECVQSFGGNLAETFGRLDGYLHWVVVPDNYECPNDDNHVRLQIRMNNQYYDVPVNIESTGAFDPRVYHYDLYADLHGGAWNEGWHTSGISLDYVDDLGVSSDDFVPATLEELVALFEDEIIAGNPVSIFMESFGSGGHDIHRNDYFSDGAIVTDPLGNPHYYLFKFADQVFGAADCFPLTECNGECVDTSSDARYCGNCNTHCEVDQVCENSQCEVTGPDGTKKWEFSTGNEIYSSPAIGSDGTIYVGSTDGNLYAIDPDGGKKWDFSTGAAIYASPSIGSDGTVYTGSDKLYAIRPADGGKKWEFAAGGNMESCAIGVDGTIYSGSSDNKLYAINPTDGSKKWEFIAEGAIVGAPAVGADGTVYFGSDDRKLYAINPTTGGKNWEFETGSYVQSTPAIGADGTIYIGSRDDKLYAVNPDGSKKWEFLTGNNVDSSFAIGADGTIYAGSADNKLYAINPADGSEKWEFEAGWCIYSTPAIGADGTIFVGSWDGRLYAVNPADGSVKWEFSDSGWMSTSAAIATDGTIYIGTTGNKLYAVNSTSGGLASNAWPKMQKNNRNTGRVGD